MAFPWRFPFPLGKRDPVDKLTIAALRRLLQPGWNCVDVGAHRGVILERIVAFAPQGRHVAIEPLPKLASRLRKRFPKVAVHEAALSDDNGVSEFHHVLRVPAYSGLRRRRYERGDETVELITVKTRRLDDLLDPGQRIDFVKIDVEGGELGVLRGAPRTLSTHRPVILFEHGLGAAEFYGAGPAEIHDLLAADLGYAIFTLSGWLDGAAALDSAGMEEEFNLCRGYMFLAIPRPTL